MLIVMYIFLPLLQAENNGVLLPAPQNHHLEIKEHYVRKRKRLQQGQKRYLELDFNDEKVR